MTEFKLVRRDICAMCQTSQKELEALREVEDIAKQIVFWTDRKTLLYDRFKAAIKKLDEARGG